MNFFVVLFLQFFEFVVLSVEFFLIFVVLLSVLYHMILVLYYIHVERPFHVLI